MFNIFIQSICNLSCIPFENPQTFSLRFQTNSNLKFLSAGIGLKSPPRALKIILIKDPATLLENLADEAIA